MNSENLRGVPYMRQTLEYIPVRTNPARGVSLPGVPSECVRMEEGPGPLMAFVLGMGQYITVSAIFAAFALMMMVATA